MKNMNWKQLWTSYPPAESPRRLDFFWVDELPWSLKASSGRSLPSIACHTKARKITSKHGNSRELQKATNIMMIMMSFFSGTPFFFCHSIFSVKKNQGNPEFLGALNFIIEFFWGVVFWSSNRGCTSPRDWWHPSELTQIIDQPAEIPYPNHIPGLKTHSLGLGLG